MIFYVFQVKKAGSYGVEAAARTLRQTPGLVRFALWAR
jgi:hypothetical protein